MRSIRMAAAAALLASLPAGDAESGPIKRDFSINPFIDRPPVPMIEDDGVPMAKGGDLEVIVINSAPPKLAALRLGSYEGSLCLAWVGSAIRKHQIGLSMTENRPTAVIYVKFLPRVQRGLRERARLWRREWRNHLAAHPDQHVYLPCNVGDLQPWIDAVISNDERVPAHDAGGVVEG